MSSLLLAESRGLLLTLAFDFFLSLFMVTLLSYDTIAVIATIDTD